MSILIKNMDMPANCGECPFAEPTRDGLMCSLCDFLAKCLSHPKTRMSVCPLVEVPPHGDLVDRGKLRGQVYRVLNSQRGILSVLNDILKEVNTAPVVVESEEADG